MNISQLKQHIEKLCGGSEKITRTLLVELYQKISGPWINFVLTLLGIPLALLQSNVGKIMNMGISFGIGMLFYGLNAVSLSLGKIGILPALVSAWLVPIIFIISGIVLLRHIPH